MEFGFKSIDLSAIKSRRSQNYCLLNNNSNTSSFMRIVCFIARKKIIIGKTKNKPTETAITVPSQTVNEDYYQNSERDRKPFVLSWRTGGLREITVAFMKQCVARELVSIHTLLICQSL